jgi:ketosteroid isomerase-like protein
MSHVETIEEIYAAFRRGDIRSIMDKLDDGVEWDVEVPVPGVPWLQPRRGKSEVPAFFQSLAPLSFPTLDPHTFFEAGDRVLALIHLEVDHAPSGKHYSVPYEGHLWSFNEAGRIVKYQHITDTALHQRCARGE